MKLKLPLTLLAALVSSVAYAATPNTDNTVTVNDGKGTFNFSTENGTVTSDFVGERGSDKTFSGDTAKSGKASGAVTALHKSYVSADGTVHYATNTDLTIGDEAGTPTTVTYASSGIHGDLITGNKTITVQNGAKVSATLVGGSIYESSYAYNTKPSGLTKLGSYYFNPSSTDATITVNLINGATATEVIGGNMISASAVTSGAKDSDGYTKFVGNEKVVVNIEGEGTTAKTVGGSMYGAINNSVTINIKDGATVTGKVFAGSIAYASSSTNIATYIKSSHITISGETTTIGASVFGGGMGQYDSNGKLKEGSNSDVLGDTIIEVSGGNLGKNIFGGSDGGNIGGNTQITLTGGHVTGSVYGGSAAGSVEGGTTIVIDGATIEKNVYGGGKDGGTVKKDSTIHLLSGDVKGTISGDGEGENSKVEGNKTLIVGTEEKAYTGTVGNIEGFDTIIVAEGSSLHVEKGNAFVSNDMTVTLSTKNLSMAAINCATAELDGALTLSIGFEGAPKSGKYMIIASDSAVQGWDQNNITLKGVAGFDDLQWSGNTLYFVYRGVDIDAMTTANWGVFKSSQAFTGTLWAPRPAESCLDLTGENKYTAWGTVYSHNSRIGSNGADYSLYGGAIGVEKTLSAKRFIGAALGYDWGKVNPFSTTSVDQDSFHLAAYGRAWHWCPNSTDAVSIDWSAAYGSTTSDHSSIAGDWTQDSLQLDARATYHRELSERTTVNAFVGAQYYAQGSDTVGDNKAKAMQNLRFMLGGGISYQLNKRTALYGEASLYQDVDRHNPSVTSNGAQFHCTNPGRFGGNVSAGVEYKLNNNWSMRANYGFSTADDQNEHYINVGAVYKF